MTELRRLSGMEAVCICPDKGATSCSLKLSSTERAATACTPSLALHRSLHKSIHLTCHWTFVP